MATTLTVTVCYTLTMSSTCLSETHRCKNMVLGRTWNADVFIYIYIYIFFLCVCVKIFQRSF